MSKLTRQEVYNLIDGERTYQDSRWNDATTTSEGKHTPAEWLLYIEHYLMLARTKASTLPDPQSTVETMDIVRKIAAMTVAAMEQNGAPPRK